MVMSLWVQFNARVTLNDINACEATREWSLPVIIALSDPAIREEEAIRGDYLAAGNQRLSGPANSYSEL